MAQCAQQLLWAPCTSPTPSSSQRRIHTIPIFLQQFDKNYVFLLAVRERWTALVAGVLPIKDVVVSLVSDQRVALVSIPQIPDLVRNMLIELMGVVTCGRCWRLPIERRSWNQSHLFYSFWCFFPLKVWFSDCIIFHILNKKNNNTTTHPPMKPFMTPIPSLFLSRATSELNAVPNLCKLCLKKCFADVYCWPLPKSCLLLKTAKIMRRKSQTWCFSHLSEPPQPPAIIIYDI